MEIRDKMEIGIIGGTKGLGKTLASYLKHDDFNVTITGRDEKRGFKVSKELGVKYNNNNLEVAKSSDILIISVPISITEDIIKELGPHMKSGSLMIDVTSVKTGPTYTMRKYLPKDVESIPTHPVFGPRTPSFEGQVIVLTPLEKGSWYPKVYDYFKSKNMRIIETDCEHHDDMMGIVQVLTHFSYISIASAIEKLHVNIKETEPYESPIYNIMIDTIARITAQNPYLTYSIQSENRNGEKIRQAFADAVLELKDALTREDDEEFREIAIRATKNMGDVKAALGRSDKIIESLSEESNRLHESIGREIGLKHIYSGKVHVGVVKEIKDDFVVLDDNTNKENKLKISNLRILSDEELFKWKKSNWKIYTNYISCIFPKSSDANIIKDTLSKLPDITSVKVSDIYNGPQIDDDKVSYTYEVQSLSIEAFNNVSTLILGFGGKIR